MNRINKLVSITSAIICSGITTITSQLPAVAGDVSPLCENLNMGTQILISTKEFNAAICDKYYIEPQSGCPMPLEYFYVGQSRKTGESIVLPASDVSTSNPFMRIYKAQNGNYTYQIASSGAYGGNSWTSLSVFNKGY
ncbi:hypothetical protein [Geminocystis herdmanii]|uniref:hypothetical protein n=1 Tax=Geminocystis herdmanii TaxID=669359 RepID=UPI00034A7453|nr:hypothetical protein [Geminocystis herdmanii]